MNERERIIASVKFQTVDRLPFRHAYGLMPGVLEQWYDQGLPRSVSSEKDIYEHFGFPTRARPLPLSIDFDPPFETKVLEDTDTYRIAIDNTGRKTKVLKLVSTLPRAVEFPVKDEATWQDYKRRLRFSPDRVGDDLEQVAQANIADGHLNSFGARGFYWFPRDLFGDENLCLAYYEQPQLVGDIVETWCELIEQLLQTALERVKLDSIHFGEDMAYRSGSMIGPNIFDQFMRPYYQRIHRLVQRYDVPIFSVDTDGNCNDLIDWFADCRVNLIGPNEVQAGNDIHQYRRRMGAEMAYDGGLDKRVLALGRAAIDQMLEATIPFMKETGGGWIVCVDHRIVPGTPLGDFQYYVDRVREMITF